MKTRLKNSKALISVKNSRLNALMTVLLLTAVFLFAYKIPLSALPVSVSTFAELKAAVSDPNVTDITIKSDIAVTEGLTVASDKTISGAARQTRLFFQLPINFDLSIQSR